MNTSSIKEQLEEIFRSGKHSHAYLFSGELNITRETALSCAYLAIGGEGSQDSHNPDLLVLQCEEGEQGISIDQIRNIKKFLSLEPYFGNQRIVIIENSEKMKNEASSALLKVLEEPPLKSSLILLTEEKHLILDTILSRVQKIDFSRIIQRKDIDKKQGICNTLSSVILAKTSKRFTIIQEMKESDIDVSLFNQFVLYFHDLLQIALLESKESLHNSFYIKQYQDVLSRTKYTPDRIASVIPSLIEYAHSANTTNANKRLLLERIALLL